MYFGTNKVSEKLSIHSEAQYRTYEFVSNFNQLLLRTGVNYQISDNATVTLGYGYISTDPTFSEFDSEKKIIEHRIFQQFSLRNTVGKFIFSHRYRIEQRFIDVPLAGSLTEHRGRYLLRITYPLNDDWFLTVYDEVFINFQEPIFGQNRLYGAVGYKFNKDVSVQFGYLKNHFTGVNFNRLQAGIWWNTDLRRKSQKKTDS
jgi:long-subunit fatty acid transport protein